MKIAIKYVTVREIFEDFVFKIKIKPVPERDLERIIFGLFGCKPKPYFVCMCNGGEKYELYCDDYLLLSLLDYLMSREFYILDDITKSRLYSTKIKFYICDMLS